MMARPTKYNQDFHPLLGEALAINGLTDIQIAEKMGISEATLYNWQRDHGEFLEAIQRGKDTPDDQVENALLKKALGFREKTIKAFNSNGVVIYGEYDEYYPPDTAAIFIWLKNRRPGKWRDRQEIVTGEESPKTIILKVVKDGKNG